jgi:ABC-2 type transport system ATP-binding protein
MFDYNSCKNDTWLQTNLRQQIMWMSNPVSMHENDYCISVSNLKKQYGKNNAYAVNSITFNVRYGTVFGFLGPNGAGKTTTLKILTTLLNPSSGSVCIFGKDLVKNQSEIKKRIGVVSQNPSFEANLTIERALDLYGMLWGLRDRKIRKEKVNEVLKTFELGSIRNAKNDELSIGQRRRVQVAREFMHDMDLLFAIIDKGEIIAFDTPAGLKQKYGRGTKTIELTFKDMLNKSFIDLLNTTISKTDGNVENNKNNSRSHIDVNGTRMITITVNNAEQIIAEILKLVYINGLNIESIAINPPSLEEVFLSIIKKTQEKKW